IGTADAKSSTPPSGRLATNGASWVSMIGGGVCLDSLRLYDWRTGGSATMLYETCVSSREIAISGDYAYWPTTRRNIAAGTDVSISWPKYSDDAGTVFGGSGGLNVGPNGDVVGWGEDVSSSPWSYPLLRYRAGSITKLRSYAKRIIGGMVTDGTNV